MKNKPLRGFDALIGETIIKVDATAINTVSIRTASGKVVNIDADEQHYGIGIVNCSLKKNKE